jgi:hypothetical protein
MSYGLYWNREYLKDERKSLARAWASERKEMFAARKAILATGDYQRSLSSRMRLRSIEKHYWNIRAIQSGRVN